jgi:RimJ/RimL family protein N-acetyltransferase
MPMNICQTQRLNIRRFIESDAAFIVKLLNEEAFIKNINDKKVRNNKDAIKYLLDGPIATYNKFGFGLYLVTLKESTIPIGMCGLLKREEFEYADLGYSILEEHCGKGYAREAAVAVLKEVGENTELTKVIAVTAIDNESSQNLLKKVGFSVTGTIELYEQLNNLYEYNFS